ALVIEALGRSVPEREPGDFAQATRRLAEVFGGIQARVIETIVRERSGRAQRDELTGLPGEAELNEWLEVMTAEYRRHGHPFATMLIDIEGLGQINDAYGGEAAQGGAGQRLGISIGVASCPDHGETAERLLETAEEATFAAKADGKHVVLAGPG